MSTKGKQNVAQSSERGIVSINPRGDIEKFCPNPDCTQALCLKGDECGFMGEDSSAPVTEVSSRKELPMTTMF